MDWMVFRGLQNLSGRDSPLIEGVAIAMTTVKNENDALFLLLLQSYEVDYF